MNVANECGSFSVYSSGAGMTAPIGNSGKPPLGATTENRALHPSWTAFIRFCRDLGHGEIERLSIQDGLPVLASTTRKKVKFTA